MKEVTHVYFVPGMAADVSIFEFIKLPETILSGPYASMEDSR